MKGCWPDRSRERGMPDAWFYWNSTTWLSEILPTFNSSKLMLPICKYVDLDVLHGMVACCIPKFALGADLSSLMTRFGVLREIAVMCESICYVLSLYLLHIWVSAEFAPSISCPPTDGMAQWGPEWICYKLDMPSFMLLETWRHQLSWVASGCLHKDIFLMSLNLNPDLSIRPKWAHSAFH